MPRHREVKEFVWGHTGSKPGFESGSMSLEPVLLTTTQSWIKGWSLPQTGQW